MEVSRSCAYCGMFNFDALADCVLLNQDSVQQVLDLYPDDPSQGIPLNTGDGVLPSGFQDKRMC